MRLGRGDHDIELGSIYGRGAVVEVGDGDVQATIRDVGAGANVTFGDGEHTVVMGDLGSGARALNLVTTQVQPATTLTLGDGDTHLEIGDVGIGGRVTLGDGDHAITTGELGNDTVITFGDGNAIVCFKDDITTTIRVHPRSSPPHSDPAIFGGDGNHHVYGTTGHNSEITVELGEGSSTIALLEGEVSGQTSASVRISAGAADGASAGGHTVLVEEAARLLTVDVGNGDDFVLTSGGNYASVKTNAGDDVVAITDSGGRSVRSIVDSGAGDDLVFVDQALYGTNSIDGGAGTDTLIFVNGRDARGTTHTGFENVLFVSEDLATALLDQGVTTYRDLLDSYLYKETHAKGKDKKGLDPLDELEIDFDKVKKPYKEGLDPLDDLDIWFDQVTKGEKSGSISGRFFHDANKSDLDDAGDGATADQIVVLLIEDGTIASNAAGDPVFTRTASDGTYSFDDVAAGAYKVGFAPPAGKHFVTQGADLDGDGESDDPSASDVDPDQAGVTVETTPGNSSVVLTTDLITVSAGENKSDVDAGARHGNRPPIAEDDPEPPIANLDLVDPITWTNNTITATGNALANDSDPDGDTIVISSAGADTTADADGWFDWQEGSAGGEIRLNLDGTYQFRDPDLDFAGLTTADGVVNTSVEYRIADESGEIDTAELIFAIRSDLAPSPLVGKAASGLSGLASDPLPGSGSAEAQEDVTGSQDSGALIALGDLVADTSIDDLFEPLDVGAEERSADVQRGDDMRTSQFLPPVDPVPLGGGDDAVQSDYQFM